jgi:hypothetical protein
MDYEGVAACMRILLYLSSQLNIILTVTMGKKCEPLCHQSVCAYARIPFDLFSLEDLET